MKYVVPLIIVFAISLIGCSNRPPIEIVQDNPNTDAVTTAPGEQTHDEDYAVPEEDSGIAEIDVSSGSLTEDGKWITAIYSTKANPAGSNLSPQLSWSDVEGANMYAIYMIDRSANNWLHWMARNVQTTTLELGAEIADSDYIGPYPPSGIHHYEIIVYALEAAPDHYGGFFDSSNYSVEDIEEELDTAEGKSGNIIGKGSIIGTVTVGETVE